MSQLKSLFRRITTRREDGSMGRDLSVAFMGHVLLRAFVLLSFFLLSMVLSVEA